MNTIYQITLALAFAFLIANETSAEDSVSFRRDIGPILLKHCLACHDAKKAEGGYRIDTFAQLTSEGDSGSAGFVAGNALGSDIEDSDIEDSEALRRIMSDDEGERMPLDADPLSTAQVTLIRKWVEQGAKYDADDPKAPLSSIIPPPEHPDPPESYSRSIPITALAFSPDGSEIYVGGYHEITVWNVSNGILLRRITNQGQRTYALSLSPDGLTLAAAGGSPGRLGEVRLFDRETGSLKRVLASTADVVFDASFNPTGTRIALVAADSTIQIFDLDDGAGVKAALQEVPQKIAEKTRGVDEAKQLVPPLKQAKTDSEVLLKQRKTLADEVMQAAGKVKKEAEKMSSDSIIAQALTKLNEAGELLANNVAAAQKDLSAKAEALQKAEESVVEAQAELAKAKGYAEALANRTDKMVIISHSDWVNSLAWSSDGKMLATTSRDKTAKVFNAETAELLVTYSGHNDAVLGIAFAADNKHIYSSGADRKIHLWDIAEGKKTSQIDSFQGEVYKLSATDHFLFAPSADKTVRQFNQTNRKQVREFIGHKDWVLTTALSTDAKRLASGSFDGEVRIWDADTGKPTTIFIAAPGLAN